MRPTVFFNRTSSGNQSPTTAKQLQMRTDAGSRPTRSASSRTVRTTRCKVSSVKKVCKSTASKARPASRRLCGPNALSSSGICSSNSVSSTSSGHFPAGPS